MSVGRLRHCGAWAVRTALQVQKPDLPRGALASGVTKFDDQIAFCFCCWGHTDISVELHPVIEEVRDII
jgi:hypothetical protein